MNFLNILPTGGKFFGKYPYFDQTLLLTVKNNQLLMKYFLLTPNINYDYKRPGFRFYFHSSGLSTSDKKIASNKQYLPERYKNI